MIEQQRRDTSILFPPQQPETDIARKETQGKQVNIAMGNPRQHFTPQTPLSRLRRHFLCAYWYSGKLGEVCPPIKSATQTLGQRAKALGGTTSDEVRPTKHLYKEFDVRAVDG
jgi:hypothetical protein